MHDVFTLTHDVIRPNGHKFRTFSHSLMMSYDQTDINSGFSGVCPFIWDIFREQFFFSRAAHSVMILSIRIVQEQSDQCLHCLSLSSSFGCITVYKNHYTVTVFSGVRNFRIFMVVLRGTLT